LRIESQVKEQPGVAGFDQVRHACLAGQSLTGRAGVNQRCDGQPLHRLQVEALRLETIPHLISLLLVTPEAVHKRRQCGPDQGQNGD
jgi:hypothetical protein